MAMSPLLRVDLGRFWHSPVRVACLLLVVLMALVMGPQSVSVSVEHFASVSDWLLAGKSMYGAALMGGLLACGWSASQVLDDRDGNRLETLIASNCGVCRYLAVKLAGPIGMLLVPGAATVAVVFAYRFAVLGSAELLPLLAAYAVVYLPIIVFSACFGLCVGTLTRSRPVAIAAFAVLWAVSFLGFMGAPPESQVVDVTGEALAEVFAPAAVSVDDFVADGVSLEESQAIADYATAHQTYSRMNAWFLAIATLASLGLLWWRLRRAWKVDASSLIANARAKEGLSVPLPRALLELNVMGFGKTAGLAFAALALGALPFLTELWREGMVFALQSATPLCFAFAYASVFALDARAGTLESVLCLPHPGRVHARRLALVTLTLLAVLAFQAVSYQQFLELDVASIMLMGLVPSLFMGGLAYLLSVAAESESTASTFCVMVWLVLHVPQATALSALPGIGLLVPFSSDALAAVSGGPLAHVPVAVVGLVLFAVGQRLAGQSERLLRR